MANIDHYHGDEMRHMLLLQGSSFRYAASQLLQTITILCSWGKGTQI